nr:alpha/beta fold hydrolase [Haloferula luteola]
MVGHLNEAQLHPWQATWHSKGTAFSLAGASDCAFHTDGYDLLPTDAVEFTGKYSTRPDLQPGIGAPFISSIKNPPPSTGPLPPDIRAKTLTAVVRFDKDHAELTFLDPYDHPTVTIGNHTYPLAADYLSNTCFTLSQTRIDKFGLIRLIRPDRFSDTAQIHPIQPYDPERVPILFVHGLQDTPATFAPMYYNLMADPEIRKHYQFWTFSYPSGYPYPWSAALLRRELDRMQRECPGHQEIVIIGHSMGGLISRLMVTDAGDQIWRNYFGAPPAQSRVRGESRRILEESLIFQARSDISRAIFINAPHRGSDLATNWIGRIGSRLVKLPTFLADVRDATLSVVTADSSGLVLDRVPNSIDTLSPRSPFIRAVDPLPIATGIPYHSIIGDRGFGNTPRSSDGVVAYWSSHLDGATSERIVPSWHSGHQSPEGIDEVRQILRRHIGLAPAPFSYIPPNPTPSSIEFHQGPPGRR